MAGYLTADMKFLIPLLLTSFGPLFGQDAYLFVTFRGEDTPMAEQVYFMISDDGQDWDALNGGEPVLISSLGEKGVRDPFILPSPDRSKFFLIATDLSIHLTKHDWKRAENAGSQSIVVWESEDLIRWSEPRLVKVAPDNAGCTWAPEAIYDEKRGEYMVFWASKTADDRFLKQRIWAAHTRDFKSFGEPFIYIEKPTTVIDTTIVQEDGIFHRFTKDEKQKAITLESSRNLMSGWRETKGFSLKRLNGYEGPTCFRLKPTVDGAMGKWCLLLDWYARGKGYRPYVTDHLAEGNFTEAPQMNFPFHPVRHGTVMPISHEEMTRLRGKWGRIGLESKSAQVKTHNMVVDPDAGTAELPVMPGTDLTSLDPKLQNHGMELSPKGPQDFSEGPVLYTLGGGRELQVTAVEHHNPILRGYFADPDIIYSEKERKYFLYPTSDGFEGWSGTDFKAFSSSDLVNWRNEGVIVDLKKDVAWADRNAWAPSIIEKKVNDGHRYYLYFSAAQKIGVAAADSPTGPFRDLGQPLIDFKPEGVRHGQEIDPDVFQDPITGKYYLYWGNGYLAVAELNDNMASIRKSTLQVMTVDSSYREGAHVFYRKGIYYFLWSENDTRSPDYRVRYAMATSPTGPLKIPEDNLVIGRRDEAGIFGTGHNSTISPPDSEERYIVYHRFTYPDGIEMGERAGYHREVCIDRMEFASDGRILRVMPTHEGVPPVPR